MQEDVSAQAATINGDDAEKSLRWVMVKKYVSKIISAGLLISGVTGLGKSLWEIFNYSSAVQVGVSVTQAEFHQLLRVFVVGGARALIESVYGAILMMMRVNKIRLAHLIVGLVLFLVPLVLNDGVVSQLEKLLVSGKKVELTKVYAQTTPPTQAIADYRFALQKYREAHKDYLAAKNSYFSFNTLNSRTEAIDKTKALLTQRDEMMRTYMFALRMSVLENPGIDDEVKRELDKDIIEQETFLMRHRAKVPAISGLDEVESASAEFAESFPAMQVLAYVTLQNLMLGDQVFVTEVLKEQHGNLSELMKEASSSDFNLTQANQWLEDTESVWTENELVHAEAETLVSKLKPKSASLNTNQRDFAKIISIMNTAKQKLVTVVGFLQETIQLVKHG